MYNETKTHEITVDTVILTIKNNALQALLIRRDREPFKDKWAIPGGYVRMSENLEQAAVRILKEKTDVDNVYLEQLYTFGDPLRHPDSRVITCVYFALVRYEDVKVVESEDVAWYPIDDLPPLAFDHKEIIDYTRARVRLSLKTCPVAYQLLNEKFTLTEMQKVYELIMGKKLDKRNFRKKVLGTEGLITLDEFTKASSKRPARLYQYKQLYSGDLKSFFIANKEDI
ncbi:MAG: NUDIX hydrolase [Candidatus Melainabacteria bacterium]|nr:MAG: NUDIX hydrolase [Candidatus Melainabacteria bacterium]RAI12271.1 MAG: NUDIX hydrolase [Candidatus Melainabacteria bacterium]